MLQFAAPIVRFLYKSGPSSVLIPHHPLSFPTSATPTTSLIMPRAAPPPLDNNAQFLADSLAETIDQVHKLKGGILGGGPGPERQDLVKILDQHMVSS